ncbi:hypothetical protein FB565_004278 [Actinoplanes lutulentus]|uniref:Uncharacterized protein n=1 Tax=Actinoplanes lutulentus TaxID=1287878 RepID=A0A327ZIK6_9ACTN|nr:hypothetical protein [Actinoplanes lutulentus]MBB2944549.1 hypothetical protein [Actinoplanes lutulentus]RAK42220.1 hypothetical protein B0I29_10245 [Actinoplanes lutulentus]
MENTPEISNKRVWLRYLVIAISCAPLAVISVVHTMGRTDDFGILGDWYVMVPLTVAAFLAWTLIEKAITWATRPELPHAEAIPEVRGEAG